MIHKKIARFEDMTVWQEARELAVATYKITKQFPPDEKYGLTSQIRRSASSVSANIAEGFGRGSRKEHSHFYRIAFGSLLETKNFIYLSAKLGYIGQDEVDKIIAQIDSVQDQINTILKYFKYHG